MDFERAAFGIAGLESAVPLVLELVDAGLLSPLRMIEALSTMPAKIIGREGGSLAPGMIADVTLINPKKPHELDSSSWRSKGKNTPFNGRKVPGCAVMTLVGGEVVFELRAER